MSGSLRGEPPQLLLELTDAPAGSRQLLGLAIFLSAQSTSALPIGSACNPGA